MVYIIQKIITCEGRFCVVFLYHIKLLMHLRGDCTISLPYFLLQSLTKMSKTMQKQRKNKDTSLHHFGLIKILIEFELQKIGITWERFLITNEFVTDEEQKATRGTTEIIGAATYRTND